MLLILGDKSNSTLKAFREYSASRGVSSTWLDESDIVDSLEVDDSIDSFGNVKIRWRVGSVEMTPRDVCGVLNFLDYFPGSLFAETHPDDRDYARTEFLAYLTFALQQFPNVVNQAWGGSLSGYCQSLPFQWHLVTNFGGQRVPRHFFGPRAVAPVQLLSNPNLVCSNEISNGRHWKAFHSPGRPLPDPVLLYERPRGIAIIVTVLDRHLLIKTLGDRIHQDPPMTSVAPLIYALCDRFHIRLAEVLFFYDQTSESLTFGSIQPGANIAHMELEDRERWLSLLFEALACDQL